jgi:hypothetical protein
VLLHTRLGELRGPDPDLGEPFWHEVIGWLCRLQGLHRLDAGTLDEVLAEVERWQRQALDEGRKLVLKGRTAASVLRGVEVRRETAVRSAGGAYPTSGLVPMSHGPWQVIALDTPALLQEEGQAMGHCAWSYRTLIRKRKVALFSLRRGDHRVTVEVALGAGRVVQAKRKANRPIDEVERAIIGMWARRNHLRVCL